MKTMNGLVLAVGLAAFPGAPSALPHSLLVFSGCFVRLQEWVPLLGDKSQTATGVIHQTAWKAKEETPGSQGETDKTCSGG